MRRWITRFVALAAVLALAWWGGRTLFVSEPITVSVYPAQRGRVERTVTNSRAGTVKARTRSRLSPEIGGRVVELPIREGGQARRGDVLLRLDDRDLVAAQALARRDLEAARARREEACLAAELAGRELERHQSLAAEGIVAADLLDRRDSDSRGRAAACNAAGADVDRARAALDVAATRLSRTVLTAPFDGTVAALATEVGEYVTPSPPGLPIPPVIDLIGGGSLYVSAPLDEADAALIHEGLPVRLTLDPYPGREFSGRVVRIAPFVLDVEEQNRTFEVEAIFDDAEFASQLLPGTSADIEVILEVAEDVLRIPANALLAGNKVLVLRDGLLVEAAVELGLRNWDFAEVLAGLREGEAVVTSLDRAEVAAGARAVEHAPP